MRLIIVNIYPYIAIDYCKGSKINNHTYSKLVSNNHRAGQK